MKRSLLLLPLGCFAVGIAVVVGSCKKDEETTNPPVTNVTVSGVVQAFGGSTIANASVQFYSGNTVAGTPVATATSNASGAWQLTLTNTGKYTYVIGATGYPTAYVTMNIASGQSTVNTGNNILAAQTINGIVNDAQTGLPIASAVVRFFSGSGNDTSGYRFADAITSASGAWTGSFTIGSYVGVIYATNHVPLVTNIPVADTTTRQLTTTVTQPVPVGQMRIILNWGLKPPDLDSHLTGDSSNTSGLPRYHVAYFNQVVRAANGDTIAFLDHDDVTSFGPETITIFKFFPGTLRYKIHDYTNRNVTGSHFMSDSSNAVVRVYTSSGLIREDHILTGTAGNQWYAYDINGATRQVTFVNTIRDGISNPADTTFRPTPLPEKTPRK
jgi:hypothetical protein